MIIKNHRIFCVETTIKYLSSLNYHSDYSTDYLWKSKYLFSSNQIISRFTNHPFQKNKPQFTFSYRSQETFIDFHKDYYEILGVDEKAELHQIKQKFYILAKQYHPDKQQGQQLLFKQISQAYNILSQPKLRAQYDSNRGTQALNSDDISFGEKSKEKQTLNYDSYSQMSRAQWAVYRSGYMPQNKIDYSNYQTTFDSEINIQKMQLKNLQEWNRAFKSLTKQQVYQQIQFRKQLYKKIQQDQQIRERAKQQYYQNKFTIIGDKIEKIFGKTIRRLYNSLIKK